MTVFVGAASRKQATTIDIKTAYALKRKLSPGMLLGGIAIPERHTKKSDEHKRMLEKIEHGCCFFITQAVYDLEASKQLLDDYVAESSKRNTPLVPVIFTLTPCGSAKTLAFMKWLGIHVPRALEEMLLASGDMLGGSMAYLRYVAKMLYMYGASKGVSVGFNIESVAIRREEIEASIALVEEVGAIIFNKP